MPETIKENKMGTTPIPKLIITMALPMIASMLVQALYNVVDSMFVARLNEEALTAVSLAFPVQNLMIAVAAGTGVGVNALLSKSLGEQNFEKANTVAKNGVLLAVLSAIVFAIVGTFGSRLFFTSQTSDSVIVEYGTQYTFVVTVASIGIFLQVIYERLLQSTGKTILSMITQGIGAIVNIILDPILIFGWFGLPRMEVAGAAVATVIGQITAGVVGIILNHRYNKEIHVSFRKFRPSGEIIKNIYKIGAPSILMQSIGSVTTFGMNNILLMFSATAATVFGVYFKLQSFVFMPVFGLTNAVIPIVAYNYGAQKKKRIYQTLKLSICFAVSIMLLGLALFQFIPEVMLGFFEASAHMLEIGVPALRTISLSFVFAGFCIIVGSVFQALGNGVYSLIISICRQLLIILPVAYAFAKLFGLNAVWFAYPIAEIASVILSSILLKKILKDKVKPLGENHS
ncbi:MAG: MATE family efflux transporter [Faecalimonas sp.]|nr:MATE family efflux transporter [Faecalimonas sp.]